MKAKCIVIGYGWRADFFYRIAKALPKEIEITAGVARTKERAEEMTRKYGVFATHNLEEALATNPTFVVLCVPRSIVKDYLVKLMQHQVPVLCETPPASSVEELNELWDIKEKYKGKVQVLEQYFLQPLYASLLTIIEQDTIGEVSQMMLSALHGYHAISIFRKMLGIGCENCTITGQQFRSIVCETNGRKGITHEGKGVEATRDWASILFDGGKIALMDFTSEQYFSLIRTRRLNIQGVRGEINDLTIRYLNSNNIACTGELQRIDQGVYNISEWSHQGIMFRDQFVYENPFFGARLNDDEIAVAHCLQKMQHYVETGKSFYSLREALQDTYVSIVLEQAIAQGITLRTTSQKWC